MEDQNNTEALELTEEQLQELMGGSVDDKLPPIEIPMEWYDTESFHKGIADTSHLAGVITALLNTGVDQGFVLDYLLNKQTIEHNLETAKINKEMNVEIAKHQKLAAEKQEL
ncbi:hypothetical protein [uncultured Metabacillus sp.]|uniref:hypothetical protein n=1 Tax=uncultured Metabacillus sp. TaxID=2860135 RepID=UPI00262B8DEB|nr:hypothetical protein [uncultured Metabacillus sp.]